MKELKPKQTEKFIVNCLKQKLIPYISGPAGIGKSDIVASVAEEHNLLLIDIRLSQMMPEDMVGIPTVNQLTKKAEYVPLNTFPLATDPIPDGYSGWLIFLDEMSSASEEVMAATYKLLLGHSLGNHKLHPRAVIAGAGNRSTDSAIARPLPDTLINRMSVCTMKPDKKDWISWAKAQKHTNASVINFIDKYPDMLCSTEDPKSRGELEPFPTPRSWGTVLKIVNTHEKDIQGKPIKKDAAGIPVPNTSLGFPIKDETMHMLNAVIGTTTAKAFQEFYNEAISIPQPWEVAASPHSMAIPSNTAGKSALTEELASYFIETQESSRDAVLTYMNRMDKEYSALFGQLVKEKLGNTETDKKLVENVAARLDVSVFSKMTFNDFPIIEYEIKILDPGPSKLSVIKLVRALSGCGLRETKDFVEGKPNSGCSLLFGSKDKAEKAMNNLQGFGATVKILEYRPLF